MKIQLIRSATMRIEYSGRTFITDPFFSEKFSLPSYTGASLNPMSDLPFPVSEIIEGIEMAVISHLHSDHFDQPAENILQKNMTVLCQPGDKDSISGSGFFNVIPVNDSIIWNNITITRIPGCHGTGEVLKEMGETSGFVFESEDEPVLYWTGDTIFYDAVSETIGRFRPEVIVAHSCGAVWGNNIKIVMDEEQTIALCNASPLSKVIAIHMDSFDHGTVTRRSLREYAEKNFITADRLLIPENGETIFFD